MISCIIVNYFGHQITHSAAQSVLTDCPDAEIIIVDNSNDSDESNALQQMIGNAAKIITNGSNTGFGQACNLALEKSSAEYVMLLNPDAMVFPGCLAELKSVLVSHPQLGAVSPIQYWDAARQWQLPPAWLPTGLGMWSIESAWRDSDTAYRLSMAYRKLAIQVWQGSQPLVSQRALSGGAMMVRRNALADVGGLFDPAFFMYYEDSDLCMRLRKKGWRLGLAPRAMVLHEWIHSAGKTDFMEKSKEIYMARHFYGQGQWEKRMQRSLQRPPQANPLGNAERSKHPNVLDVPAEWQKKWLLEISPSALMIPSLGHIGSGPRAEIADHLLARLGNGPAYARIGPIDSAAQDVPLVLRLN